MTPDLPPCHVEVTVGRTIWPGGSRDGVIGVQMISADDGPKVKVHGVVRLDLPSGHHTITRWSWTVFGPKFPKTIDVDLTEGQTAYLVINQYQGMNPGAVLVGGLLGGAIGGGLMGALQSQPYGDHPAGFALEEGR